MHRAFRLASLVLLGAGPLTVVIGGFASPEARLRENLALGLGLTAFAMLLFGDLLNLPIPMVPEAWAGLFPAGWSQDGRLRVTAGLLAGDVVAHPLTAVDGHLPVGAVEADRGELARWAAPPDRAAAWLDRARRCWSLLPA